MLKYHLFENIVLDMLNNMLEYTPSNLGNGVERGYSYN